MKSWTVLGLLAIVGLVVTTISCRRTDVYAVTATT